MGNMIIVIEKDGTRAVFRAESISIDENKMLLLTTNDKIVAVYKDWQRAFFVEKLI